MDQAPELEDARDQPPGVVDPVLRALGVAKTRRRAQRDERPGGVSQDASGGTYPSSRSPRDPQQSPHPYPAKLPHPSKRTHLQKGRGVCPFSGGRREGSAEAVERVYRPVPLPGIQPPSRSPASLLCP